MPDKPATRADPNGAVAARRSGWAALAVAAGVALVLTGCGKDLLNSDSSYALGVTKGLQIRADGALAEGEGCRIAFEAAQQEYEDAGLREPEEAAFITGCVRGQ